MIRSVSKILFARPNDKVLIKAELIERVDTIGNFFIETANPGSYWGTAIPQLPKDAQVPNFFQIPSFIGTVSFKQKTKELEFPCLYPTWIRVVQYLSTVQVPSVYARIDIELSRMERFKRMFSRIRAEPPLER